MRVLQLLTPLVILICATVALVTGHLSETAFVALLAGGASTVPAATKIGELKR
jgi:hypothetical protein